MLDFKDMGKEVEITLKNQWLLKHLIFQGAVEFGNLPENGRATGVQLEPKLENVNGKQVLVMEPKGTGVRAELDLSTSIMAITDKNNPNNFKGFSMMVEAIRERHPHLEYRNSFTQDGYKQVYIDPYAETEHVLGNFQLNQDIEFSVAEKPTTPKAFAKGMDVRLHEAFGTLPQDPVSHKLQVEARHLAASTMGIDNQIKISGSSSYKVNGEPVINVFGRDADGRTFCASFRNGSCRVYARDDGGYEYSDSRFFETEIADLTKHGEHFDEMGRSGENNPRARHNANNSVLNPTPLQMLVMWTELEPELKAKFAQNPYSIGDFEGYRCAANKLTCGFGSTGAEYQSRMTVDDAFSAMNKHIDFQRASLRKQIGGEHFDKLLPREQDALTSLGYNTGRIGDGLVYLVREYANNPNDESRDKVTDKMMEYCKYRPSKGAPLQVASGLESRRKFEVAVFTGEIDELPQKSLHWLVPHSIGEETREQLKEFCNSEDNNRNSAAISNELKQQGVSDKINGYLPQEVIDAALVQAQHQSQVSNLS